MQLITCAIWLICGNIRWRIASNANANSNIFFTAISFTSASNDIHLGYLKLSEFKEDVESKDFRTKLWEILFAIASCVALIGGLLLICYSTSNDQQLEDKFDRISSFLYWIIIIPIGNIVRNLSYDANKFDVFLSLQYKTFMLRMLNIMFIQPCIQP